MSQATVSTPALNVRTTGFMSIQAVWTGSPVGTIALKFSNDNVTYTDYSGSAVAVSGAGDTGWLLDSVEFYWIKVVYTKTSGTGSLTVKTMSKAYG